MMSNKKTGWCRYPTPPPSLGSGPSWPRGLFPYKDWFSPRMIRYCGSTPCLGIGISRTLRFRASAESIDPNKGRCGAITISHP